MHAAEYHNSSWKAILANVRHSTEIQSLNAKTSRMPHLRLRHSLVRQKIFVKQQCRKNTEGSESHKTIMMLDKN